MKALVVTNSVQTVSVAQGYTEIFERGIGREGVIAALCTETKVAKGGHICETLSLQYITLM